MASDGSVKIDSSIDGSGFSKGLSKLGGTAKTALSATAGAIAGSAAALGGLAAAAVKTGSDFESQMSRVKAISGATGADFDALNKQAVALGASTVFSATEAAQGMENLASAGFSTKEIMSAMPGMLDLAASSGEDLAASADIAASTLREFGLSADKAGHVADVLAKNAAQTNAAVADTGEAMKYIGTIANSAGWSLESVTAAIGEMANAGIKGSQAGTTLRGALTNLMNPSKVQAEAMQAIGFSAYDASGHMKSLSQIISDLQKDTAGLTEQQRDQAIASIMGTDALSGMQVLIKNGSGSLDSLTKSLQNSDGSAKAMAAAMNDNLKGAVQNLTGSLESLGISFYQSIDNPLKDVVNKANGYIGQLASAFESGGMQGLVAALGSVAANAVASIAAQAPQMINLATLLIQSLVNGLSQNTAQVSASAIKIMTALIRGITVLLPDLLNLAIKLILSLADDLSQNANGITSGGSELMNKLVDTLIKAAPQLAAAATKIAAAFFAALMQQNPPAGIFLGLTGAVKGVQGAFSGLDKVSDTLLKMQNAGNLVSNITGAFKNAKGDFDTIRLAAMLAGDKFKALGGGILNVAKTISGGTLTGIKNLAGGISSLAQGAASLTVNLAQTAAGFIKMGAQALASVIQLAAQKAATLASAAAQKLAAAAQWLLNAAMSANPIAIIIIALAAVTAALVILWNTNEGFRNALISAWNAISAAAQTVWGAVVDFFTKTIPNAWNNFVAFMKTWGPLILALVAPILGVPLLIIQHWSQIQSFFAGLWKSITGIFGSIGKWFGDRFNDAKNAIFSVFKPNMLSDLGGNLLKGLWNGVTGAVKWLFGKIKDLGKGIVDQFKEAFGIHSPSTVLRDEIGKMLPPGIAVGFEAAAPAAARDMQAQMSGMVAKMQASVTARQTQVSSTITSGTAPAVVVVQQAAAEKSADTVRIPGKIENNFIVGDELVTTKISPLLSRKQQLQNAALQSAAGRKG